MGYSTRRERAKSSTGAKVPLRKMQRRRGTRRLRDLSGAKQSDPRKAPRAKGNRPGHQRKYRALDYGSFIELTYP